MAGTRGRKLVALQATTCDQSCDMQATAPAEAELHVKLYGPATN